MIYLDNAATTFPKPEEVYQAVDYTQRNMAVNVGRGSYKVASDAMKIVDEGLSVRAVEKMVRDAKEPKPAKKEKVKDHNLIYVEEIMQKKLQTKVKVEGKSITIAYQDTKDLNRILELIGCIEED